MRVAAIALVVATATLALGAGPAEALNPAGIACGAAKLATGTVVNPCSIAKHGAGAVLGVGKKLISGNVGGAASSAAGAVTSAAAGAVGTVAFAAMGSWVLGGARSALDETAKVIGQTTSPQLTSTWFSGTYWRMAGIAGVLTLPFLFAAAVQALLRSDLGLLLRAALLHLPLALLVVSIAAPLTMLLLSASDEMSSIVSSAAGNGGAHFLSSASEGIAGLTAVAGSPFLAFLIGIVTVAAAIVLWIELLMRETAVYVIVLMLPLAFAALVWPARRMWAVRTVELLCALILSKFAIVAVLSLGGAALGSATEHHDVTTWLAGLVIVAMAAIVPWALLRFVPMAEIAAGAAGSLRGELRPVAGPLALAHGTVQAGDDWAALATGRMRRQAQALFDGGGGQDWEPPSPGVGAPIERTSAGGAEPAPAGSPGSGRANAPTDPEPPEEPFDWGSEYLNAPNHSAPPLDLGAPPPTEQDE